MLSRANEQRCSGGSEAKQRQAAIPENESSAGSHSSAAVCWLCRVVSCRAAAESQPSRPALCMEQHMCGNIYFFLPPLSFSFNVSTAPSYTL